MDFNYCVVIRTLGNGGGKYRALLDSIDNQIVKPRDVYVVIAEGYKLPKERLGYEKFLVTTKGMWHQRVFGMQYAAKYNPDSLQLVCDDDVSFDANFVSDLYNNMCESEADAMIPYMFSSDSWAVRVYNGILGNKYITKKEDYRVQICNTAGFVVSSSKKNLMLTQSGRFNIFMIKSCCIDKLSLEDEYWLDVTKYALPDDQVFFYKCFLKKIKVVTCLTPSYIHLDHGASSPSRLLDMAYASARNYLIFWYRFLFEPSKSTYKRCVLFFSILYRILMSVSYRFMTSIIKKNFKIVQIYIKGVKDAIEFIKHPDYKKLNKIN